MVRPVLRAGLTAMLACASAAAASADDATVRAVTGSWAGKPEAYVVDGATATDDAGHAVTTASMSDPDASFILGEKDGKVLLGMEGPAVRIALWVDALAPVVVRAVALDVDGVPRTGRDGVFLDPGARVTVDEHADGRAHVTTAGGVVASGWIPDGAIGTRFTPPRPRPGTVRGIGHAVAIQTADGATLATSDGAWAEDLGHGRVSLESGYVRAVGTLVEHAANAGGEEDGDPNGVEGGVEGGVVGGPGSGAPAAPPRRDVVRAGACLYSKDGVVIGVVAVRKSVGEKLEVEPAPAGTAQPVSALVDAIGWSVPVYVHRNPDGAGFVRCAR